MNAECQGYSENADEPECSISDISTCRCNDDEVPEVKKDDSLARIPDNLCIVCGCEKKSMDSSDARKRQLQFQKDLIQQGNELYEEGVLVYNDFMNELKLLEKGKIQKKAKTGKKLNEEEKPWKPRPPVDRSVQCRWNTFPPPSKEEERFSRKLSKVISKDSPNVTFTKSAVMKKSVGEYDWKNLHNVDQIDSFSRKLTEKLSAAMDQDKQDPAETVEGGVSFDPLVRLQLSQFDEEGGIQSGQLVVEDPLRLFTIQGPLSKDQQKLDRIKEKLKDKDNEIRVDPFDLVQRNLESDEHTNNSVPERTEEDNEQKGGGGGGTAVAATGGAVVAATRGVADNYFKEFEEDVPARKFVDMHRQISRMRTSSIPFRRILPQPKTKRFTYREKKRRTAYLKNKNLDPPNYKNLLLPVRTYSWSKLSIVNNVEKTDVSKRTYIPGKYTLKNFHMSDFSKRERVPDVKILRGITYSGKLRKKFKIKEHEYQGVYVKVNVVEKDDRLSVSTEESGPVEEIKPDENIYGRYFYVDTQESNEIEDSDDEGRKKNKKTECHEPTAPKCGARLEEKLPPLQQPMYERNICDLLNYKSPCADFADKATCCQTSDDGNFIQTVIMKCSICDQFICQDDSSTESTSREIPSKKFKFTSPDNTVEDSSLSPVEYAKVGTATGNIPPGAVGDKTQTADAESDESDKDNDFCRCCCCCAEDDTALAEMMDYKTYKPPPTVELSPEDTAQHPPPQLPLKQPLRSPSKSKGKKDKKVEEEIPKCSLKLCVSHMVPDFIPKKKCKTCKQEICQKCFGRIRWTKINWDKLDSKENKKIKLIQHCLCNYGVDSRLYDRLLFTFSSRQCYDCFLGLSKAMNLSIYGPAFRYSNACLRLLLSPATPMLKIK